MTIEQADTLVSATAAIILVVLTVPLAMTIWRMIAGPSHPDRFVALDMLTGVAVSFSALVGITTSRREFLDVALGLSVFGFVGTCALAAFLERGGRKP